MKSGKFLVYYSVTSNHIAEQLFSIIIIYMTLHDMNSQHTSYKILILFSNCKGKTKKEFKIDYTCYNNSAVRAQWNKVPLIIILHISLQQLCFLQNMFILSPPFV
jgi:hypothetical protein